jgi:hypothetical protein
MISTRRGSRTTFDEVHTKVQADDNGKWDVLADRNDLVLRDGQLGLAHENGWYHASLAPTPWATAQLCQRLSIPVGYFRRCPTIIQDIQANYWLKHPLIERRSHSHTGNGHRPTNGTETNASQPDEAWLLRARHGTLRAVLSARYSRLDNETLLRSVRPAIQTAVSGRFSIELFALTGESLHLRLVDPSASREVLPDDRLMAGIHIANSEVGRRAVSIDAMVYRLICTNGLIGLVKGKSLLYQRHIHVSQERFGTAVENAINEALAAAAGFMEQLSQATREPIKDVDATLTRLADRWSLSQQTQERMRLSLLSERADQQETAYGMVNAITNAAQLLPPDDRYDLEVLAGHLLEHGISRSLRTAAGPRRKEAQAPDDSQSEVNRYGDAETNGEEFGRQPIAASV